MTSRIVMPFTFVRRQVEDEHSKKCYAFAHRYAGNECDAVRVRSGRTAVHDETERSRLLLHL